jgi:pimeloyl-ACP methyl ester carboxylesterase
MGVRAAVLLMLVIAAPACSPQRTVESLGVLYDIAAMTTAVWRVDRQEVSFTIDGRDRVGDLYRSDEPPLAGMVLVPGAVKAGKDDPRLVRFAATVARARFEVLVPDVPGMRHLKVGSEDSRVVADALRFMRQRRPDRPLGLTAISFAIGPAVLALFEPDLEGQVDFVVAVGGYYDVEAAIAYTITGFYRDPGSGAWRQRQPNPYGKWVFLASNADRLDDPGDRSRLKEMAERKLKDSNAAVDDLAAGLKPDGRAVYALVTETDPDRVAQRMAALPPAIRREMAALDLEQRGLAVLGIPFVLVHGTGDPVIPETESMALAEALGPERSDLYLVDGLAHVDLGSPDLAAAVTMTAAISRVLSLRDAGR